MRRADETADPVAYYHFVSLTILSVMAALPHLVYIVYFLYKDIPALAVSNALSIGIYICALIVLRFGYYKTVSIVISIEIVMSAFVTVYFVGSATYYQFFILLVAIAHLSVLKFMDRERVMFMLILFACFFGTFFIENYLTPAYASAIDEGFKYFNVDFIFLAVVVMLSIEKFVNGITSTIQETKMSELTNQAYRDPLTGLYNRRYAQIYFDNIKNSSPVPLVSAALLDIDNFKEINDTYGHTNGDKALVLLSGLLRLSLRQSDFVFRWGGEEFLIAMVNTDVEAGFAVVDSIRKRVEANEMDFDGKKVKFTITAGVARLDARSLEASLVRCDENLYTGKRSGKNVVVK